jgi:Cyclic nucleotide-binding domain
MLLVMQIPVGPLSRTASPSSRGVSMTVVICRMRAPPRPRLVGYNHGMPSVDEIDAVLRVTPVFRKLTAEDRRTVAQAATIKHYGKGEVIFEQDSPSDAFYTIASGRVKIFKMLASGKDLILEVFGTGDPLGAVAAYDGRPFPASASALDWTGIPLNASDPISTRSYSSTNTNQTMIPTPWA